MPESKNTTVPVSRSELTGQTSRRALLGGAGLAGLALPAVVAASVDEESRSRQRRAQDADIESVVKRLRRRTISNDMIVAAVEALAMVGVGTYEAPDSPEPILPVVGTPSPLRYLGWQVAAMTNEVAARDGLTGAGLDSLIQPPAGAPTPSILLAAYTQESPTTGGELVRGLLGNRNWRRHERIVFPGLAQAIFVGEAAQFAVASSAAQAGFSRRAFLAPPAPIPAPAGHARHADSICSAVSGFVESVLNSVVDALKADTSGGGINGFFGDIWSGVFGIGEDVVDDLPKTLSEPDIVIVKSIATTIAVISEVISLIKPWALALEADPATNRFGVGDERVTGALIATVKTGLDTEWPTLIKDCAAEAGVTLPSLIGTGSPASWELTETPIDLLVVDDQQDKIDEEGNAKLMYTTNQESADTAKGEKVEGTVEISLSVEREDLQTLKEQLGKLMLATLPEFVAKVLEPIVGPSITELLDKLVALEPTKRNDRLTIVYHKKLELTPTPEEEDDGGCPYGVWQVTNIADVAEAIARNDGVDISYSEGGGSSTAEFREEGTFVWSWSEYTVTGTGDIPDVGEMTLMMMLNGKISGSFSVDGGTLTIVEVTDALSITADSYLNGTLVTSLELPASPWLRPGASLAVTCGSGGQRMVLTPLWISIDASYELMRL